MQPRLEASQLHQRCPFRTMGLTSCAVQIANSNVRHLMTQNLWQEVSVIRVQQYGIEAYESLSYQRAP